LNTVLPKIAGSLIVSCQPVPGGPFDRTDFVVAFAQAALQSGAACVRIEGLANVAAVREATRVPIIGLVKRDLADSPVRITPYAADVEALAAAGADILAFDATDRERPAAAADLCAAAHRAGRLAMADISTLAEARAAFAFGADLVGTTLSGYTGGAEPEGPDFELLASAAALGRPVIAEGRIHAPAQAGDAMRLRLRRRRWVGDHTAGAHHPPVRRRRRRHAVEEARLAMSRTLAIDIGGTKTLLALVEDGHIREERRLVTNCVGDPSVWCDEIAEAARPWRGGFAKVGAAVSGFVVDGIWSALNPATLPVRERYPLARELESRLGAPAACFNDAQAAAWGEYRFGAGAKRDLVFITVSTGIGGGVVIGGKLVVGRTGLAGARASRAQGRRSPPIVSRISPRAAGSRKRPARRDTRGRRRPSSPQRRKTSNGRAGSSRRPPTWSPIFSSICSCCSIRR